MSIAQAATGCHEPAILTPAEPSLTWDDICKIEPRLLGLAATAIILRSRRPVPKKSWDGVKKRLEQLVGWRAKKHELRTREAYNVAFRVILPRR